jgi:hypothetical protein
MQITIERITKRLEPHKVVFHFTNLNGCITWDIESNDYRVLTYEVCDLVLKYEEWIDVQLSVDEESRSM